MRSRVIVVEGGCKALSQRPNPILPNAIVACNRQIVDLRHRLTQTSQRASGLDADDGTGVSADDSQLGSDSDSDSKSDKPGSSRSATSQPPMLAVVDIQVGAH